MANNSQPSGAQSLWPPSSGSAGYGSQFRPMMPTQQGQPYVSGASQQFRPIGQVPSNVGMGAVQNQPLQFSQPMQVQQFPPRPGQPGLATPSSQSMPMPYAQTSRPLTSGSPQSHQVAPPLNSHMPGIGTPGMPVSSSYTFVPSFGQPQNNISASSQFQPISQGHAPVAPTAGQPWVSSGSQNVSLALPTPQIGQQPAVTSSTDSAANAPANTQQFSSDWQEHTSADGRRYYYNKKTRQSSWKKPLELMTPIERADASTEWEEFTTPEGRKYYYNKRTQQRQWTMPEELKLAREQAQMVATAGTQSEMGMASQDTTVATVSLTETPVQVNTNSLPASSPVSVAPVAAVNPSPSSISASAVTAVAQSAVTSVAGVQPSAVTAAPAPLIMAVSGASTAVLTSSENVVSQDASQSSHGVSVQDTEEANKGMTTLGKVNVTQLEDKISDVEPVEYANKQEAKNAFKALLESANVQSDWTWEQAMREIINDKRFAALKTLGERKQAFNEYLGQRKKLEAEERRMRQKKAREEFTKMLEESKELTSSMRWSKAQSLFENDERFKAVEKARDREDLYENYVVELERKEREIAAEERRRYIAEYRKFLESCDFIKVTSQWRKVQDRLEDDERCSRLEKIDRLLIFQDYIHDLEKEEEEKKKAQKEQLRRAERKNRDAFRKLMEEHVADGTLTAKTYWRDYCLEVKDLPQYQAVASNSSGSTPKDLFEDVTEELENQYHEEKSRVKDAMKSGKISMVSTWTLQDFKDAILEDVGSPPISDINLKLVYEDLLERAKEKQEKEVRKRQRLIDDFTKLLQTYKEVTAASSWEECKPLFGESQEYRSIGEESFRKQIFEDYVAHLLEKAKEKDRKREEEKAKKEKEKEEKEKRKEKEKERKEKDRDREREKGKERKKDETDSENLEISESYGHKEEKKKEKERDKKHRKRHQSAADDGSSDKDEKEESKKSRRHGSDRKKSRKHAHSPESDSESRHKKHKREHRDSRRNGGHEELEDGELGEDGEIR